MVVRLLFVAILCSILANFFKIVALGELKKTIVRKKVFDVRKLGNCSTPILLYSMMDTHIMQIYWIYKDAIDINF